jgi:hypothetical protein
MGFAWVHGDSTDELFVPGSMPVRPASRPRHGRPAPGGRHAVRVLPLIRPATGVHSRNSPAAMVDSRYFHRR